MNKRDYIGCACWLVLSFFLGAITLPVMVAREIWQWWHYGLPMIEYEDLIRYSLVIFVGSTFHFLVFF